MDPILLNIDSEIVINVLGMIVLLSFMVERFLAPVFEWRVVLEKIKSKGLKEPIALLLSFLIVYYYKFDALALLFKEEINSMIGYILTAGIIAGGSKGSIKLFRDYLGWKSVAHTDFESTRKIEKSNEPNKG